jgi:hypothetical protein
MKKSCMWLTLCVLAFCAAGCRKSREDVDWAEFLREVSIGLCKSIIESPQRSERAKKLAKKAIDGWDNGILDAVPILIDARFEKVAAPNHCRLHLDMSDEEMDIAGIHIKEVHQQPDGQSVVIEEDYPLFVRCSVGHYQWPSFKERGPGDRKDEALWGGYVEKGKWLSDRPYPTVWISIPTVGEIDVEISVYDSGGNMSEPLALQPEPIYR